MDKKTNKIENKKPPKIKINQNEKINNSNLNISSDQNKTSNSNIFSSNENEFPFIQNHTEHSKTIEKNSKSLPKIITKNLNPNNENELSIINKLSNVPLTERDISNINNSLTKSLNLIKSQIINNEILINSNKNIKKKILSQNQINRYHNVKKLYDKKMKLILKKSKLFDNLNLFEYSYSNSIEKNDKSNVLIFENKIKESKKEINLIEDEIKSLDLQIKYEIDDEKKENKKNLNNTSTITKRHTFKIPIINHNNSSNKHKSFNRSSFFRKS